MEIYYNNDGSCTITLSEADRLALYNDERNRYALANFVSEKPDYPYLMRYISVPFYLNLAMPYHRLGPIHDEDIREALEKDPTAQMLFSNDNIWFPESLEGVEDSGDYDYLYRDGSLVPWSSINIDNEEELA
jgi:hypothetical protein